ncbi:unnamed protein product [Amoebophrya sp. A120]|nr:unnamed protein product [Amoebophrya sp. A120]|eukprot:GSA120T00018608001.1
MSDPPASQRPRLELGPKVVEDDEDFPSRHTSSCSDQVMQDVAVFGAAGAASSSSSSLPSTTYASSKIGPPGNSLTLSMRDRSSSSNGPMKKNPDDHDKFASRCLSPSYKARRRASGRGTFNTPRVSMSSKPVRRRPSNQKPGPLNNLSSSPRWLGNLYPSNYDVEPDTPAVERASSASSLSGLLSGGLPNRKSLAAGNSRINDFFNVDMIGTVENNNQSAASTTSGTGGGLLQGGQLLQGCTDAESSMVISTSDSLGGTPRGLEGFLSKTSPTFGVTGARTLFPSAATQGAGVMNSSGQNSNSAPSSSSSDMMGSSSSLGTPLMSSASTTMPALQSHDLVEAQSLLETPSPVANPAARASAVPPPAMGTILEEEEFDENDENRQRNSCGKSKLVMPQPEHAPSYSGVDLDSGVDDQMEVYFENGSNPSSGASLSQKPDLHKQIPAWNKLHERVLLRMISPPLQHVAGVPPSSGGPGIERGSFAPQDGKMNAASTATTNEVFTLEAGVGYSLWEGNETGGGASSSSSQPPRPREGMFQTMPGLTTPRENSQDNSGMPISSSSSGSAASRGLMGPPPMTGGSTTMVPAANNIFNNPVLEQRTVTQSGAAPAAGAGFGVLNPPTQQHPKIPPLALNLPRAISTSSNQDKDTRATTPAFEMNNGNSSTSEINKKSKSEPKSGLRRRGEIVLAMNGLSGTGGSSSSSGSNIFTQQQNAPGGTAGPQGTASSSSSLFAAQPHAINQQHAAASSSSNSSAIPHVPPQHEQQQNSSAMFNNASRAPSSTHPPLGVLSRSTLLGLNRLAKTNSIAISSEAASSEVSSMREYDFAPGVRKRKKSDSVVANFPTDEENLDDDSDLSFVPPPAKRPRAATMTELDSERLQQLRESPEDAGFAGAILEEFRSS